MNSDIWIDFEFFFNRLKNLPVSKSLSLGEKGFCVSTGCSFESWVYYPEKTINPEHVKSVIKFFNDENISFMWPLYDGGGEVLEECGLFLSEELTLTAMSLNSCKNCERKNLIIKSDFDFREWAKTAWHGFGGEWTDTEEKYFALVEALNNDEKLSLYLSEYDGKNVGTFLITHEENLTGVYYFSVIPEMRRKGIAREMMNEITKLSAGKKIVLQASPAGVKFYESFGFEELFTIPVYSNAEDS